MPGTIEKCAWPLQRIHTYIHDHHWGTTDPSYIFSKLGAQAPKAPVSHVGHALLLSSIAVRFSQWPTLLITSGSRKCFFEFYIVVSFECNCEEKKHSYRLLELDFVMTKQSQTSLKLRVCVMNNEKCKCRAGRRSRPTSWIFKMQVYSRPRKPTDFMNIQDASVQQAEEADRPTPWYVDIPIHGVAYSWWRSAASVSQSTLFL